jgi:hypothetical protein
MAGLWDWWLHRVAHWLHWNACTLVIKDDAYYLHCICGEETFFAKSGQDFLTKIGL